MSSLTKICGNGVLAENGLPATEFDEDDLFELIRAEVKSPSEKDEGLLKKQKIWSDKKTLGAPPGFSPDNLASVGWGVIWPPEPLTSTEEANKRSLNKLIEYRAQQMSGLEPHQFHYQKGWEFDDFLSKEGRGLEPGDMKPQVVPYYLCIMGSPERIPWEFQQYLDGEYAVGRLWFDDPNDCQMYVEHLLNYETKATAPQTAREVLLFGTKHADDRATQNSAVHLVQPLYDWLAKEQQRFNFNPSLLLGDRDKDGAYKSLLLQRLKIDSKAGGTQAKPTLLFTAGHGLQFAKSSDEQIAKQGSLICQEWPHWLVPPEPSHYLAADDITDRTDLSGMISFCFACFSTGTPQKEDWIRPTLFRKPKQISVESFVARLPQKMLANGMLAFVGHVSKAWESSFLGAQGNNRQLGGFTAALGELLRGRRIGHATDYLNQRWIHLNLQLDRWVTKGNKSKQEIVNLWQARNDLRGYAVLGDPAVRIRPELLQ